MKCLVGLSLVTAICALAQTANPQRFAATEIRQQGAVAHLRGRVVMKVMSAVIYAEEAEFDGHEYTIAIRGDSRVSLLNVRAQPDGDFAPDEPRPLSDPRRVSAGEIRQDGMVTHLHGNVVMRMPGVLIYARDADLDGSTATIQIRGDSRFVFLKALIEPDDQLGPFVQAQ